MVVVSCPHGCGYKSEDVSEQLVSKLIELHVQSHAIQSTVINKSAKYARPTIELGANEERWASFKRRWETFKKGSKIDATEEAAQLFECAGTELGDLVLKLDQDITSRSVDEVMSTMHSLAVVPVAEAVTRSELIKMEQRNDEPFRTFVARVKGKAETCAYLVEVACDCGCGKTFNGDYTTRAMIDILLAGIYDVDIRRQALSIDGVLRKPLNELISFVERQEMSKAAVSAITVSAVSTFKRAKKQQGGRSALSDGGNSARTCPSCNNLFKPYKKGRNGWNRKPFQQCFDCWRKSGAATQNCILNMNAPVSATNAKTANQPSKVSKLSLSRAIFEHRCWRNANINTHPMVELQISHLRNGKTVPIVAIADTGAQSNLWGFNDFKSKGFSKNDLQPVNLRISAANNHSLNIIGGFNARFTGSSPKGHNISCCATIFVSDSVSCFYLSCTTMRNLAIIDQTFPTVGDRVGSTKTYYNSNLKNAIDDKHPVFADFQKASLLVINAGCIRPHNNNSAAICDCPQREFVPSRPNKLPFPAIPENNDRMKKWLLEKFSSSTFNTCPHRPLQQMTGPPLEIHIDKFAKPKVYPKPVPVPLHWQDRVYEDLLRDESLGVVQRVPCGVPVTWCHRMVITRKHDGSPRRTVDLSPLNKFCRREIYSAQSPFQLARRIPRNTWKTVTDAWNGYHSVPLRKSDRHLTTFITPFGRWRYNRAPQGYLSSGDGYNQRFATILADFPRKERCVDDTVFYDSDLEEHWWRTIDFLMLVGRSGIVLNPEKFQFARETIEFAGFRVSQESIEPLDRYIDAIRQFPTPVSNTDIRSWYGLINQVSTYAQLREHMTPFRDFLSSKTKFKWTKELDLAFEKSKMKIIEAIKSGVQIFDITKPTCLRPDWSSQGIGYYLVQKHCSCVSTLPDCCPDGWRITLAGSRFLQKAEKRYAAIEGEALAVAWSLEQTKYFTQGCRNLIVVTDHKPLVKLFGDRTLDEIDNTRLFRLKQRALPWHFKISYLPGKVNNAADALSRHPSPNGGVTHQDQVEFSINAAITRETEELSTVSWSLIAQETKKDPTLSTLIRAVHNKFQGHFPRIEPYTNYKDSLYIKDGVLMYKDRAIIPFSLRNHVLKTLHAAHQGITGMGARARSIVFWPGLTKDIERVRAECSECNRNAPSQSSLPSSLPVPPTTPFEKIYADFCQLHGNHYLIVGDRLSGWSDIYATPVGTYYSGARGLIRCLRVFFATYGVPNEIASDGGPEFASDDCRQFLQRWGVHHRVSSAYFPRSNGRAEVAVKSAKRLLRTNVGPGGSINNDNFLRAILQLRNTPDPDCGISPARILFGRPLRDNLLFAKRLKKFSNPAVLRIWREAWRSKEAALRVRFAKSVERLNVNSRNLPNLNIGDRCYIQNQKGNYPLKWERSGVIVEIQPYDKYVVKIDGSGQLTKRNRKFLRRITLPSTPIHNVPSSVSPDMNFESESQMRPPAREITSRNSPPQVPERQRPIEFVPYSLRRLKSFNNPGLKETTTLPVGRLRPRLVRPNYV